MPSIRAEPNLVPQAHAAGNTLMASLRQVPISIQDAGAKIAVAAASARAAFTQAAARATASAFLRALAVAMELMITVGGRLISVPIIIIDPKRLQLGGPPQEA